MQTPPNVIKRRSIMSPALVVATGGGALGVILLWGVVRPVLRDARRAVPLAPADAVVGVLAAVALLLIGWLTLGVVLEVLSLVPGALGRAATSASTALTPRVVRRAAGLLLGVGLGIGAGGGAGASGHPTVVALHDATERAVDRSLGATPATAALPDPGWRATPDPGWVPDRPLVRRHPDLSALGARSGTSAPGPAEVVVHRGDSLWSLTARHLGPDATDLEIAAEWPHWYATNRTVIGPDPDLLRPGQVLRAPTARTEASS